MRQIKFRARWKENGKLISDFMTNRSYCIADINSPLLIIEEFTGLVDFYGDDIYENDIVKMISTNSKNIYLVEYDTRFASFTYMHVNKGMHQHKREICQDFIDSMGIAVVGNKYYNPELLK